MYSPSYQLNPASECRFPCNGWRSYYSLMQNWTAMTRQCRIWMSVKSLELNLFSVSCGAAAWRGTIRFEPPSLPRLPVVLYWRLVADAPPQHGERDGSSKPTTTALAPKSMHGLSYGLPESCSTRINVNSAWIQPYFFWFVLHSSKGAPSWWQVVALEVPRWSCQSRDTYL